MKNFKIQKLGMPAQPRHSSCCCSRGFMSHFPKIQTNSFAESAWGSGRASSCSFTPQLYEGIYWGQTCTGNEQALTDHQEMAALPLRRTRDYLRGSLSGCCYRFCKAVTQVIAAFCNIILFCPLLNLSKDSLSVLYSCWWPVLNSQLWKNRSSK